MLRVALAGLAAHKLRLVSTALSIVLGIAFVTGTLILSDTLDRTFTDLFGQVNAGVDVEVTRAQPFESAFGAANPTAAVDRDAIDRIAEVEGVAAAVPDWTGTAIVLGPDDAVAGVPGAPQLGGGAPVVDELDPFEVREGRYPESPDEVALDAGSADGIGVSVGDSVRVQTDGPAQTYEVVGTVVYPGSEDVVGASITLFEPGRAEELFGQDGAQTVQVVAADGVDNAELSERIASELGADFQVLTGEEAAAEDVAQIGPLLDFLTTGLLVFAAVALLVGSFLIFNTFTITVAQRTRELALLRAIGAGRRQVLGAVLIEAFVVGLVGSVVGLGAGVAISQGLTAVLGATGFSLPQGDLVFLPRTAVVALVVGTLLTMVAALLPALRATRVAPVQALRTVAAPPRRRGGAARTVIGLAMLALGVTALVTGLAGDAPLAVVGVGALAVLGAMAVLSPLVTRPMATVLGAPIAAARGLTGELARENTVRDDRRTASTAAALMIGLGLVSFVLIFVASLTASVDEILEETFQADFSLTPTNFVSIPPGAVDAAADVDGVGVATSVSTVVGGVEGTARTVGVIEADAYEQVVGLVVDDGALDGLPDGGVALGRDLAATLSVGVGDTVEVAYASPDDVSEAEVVAVYDQGTADNGAQMLVERARYVEAVGAEPQPGAGYVTLAEGADVSRVRPALEAALAEFPTARLQDTGELREQAVEETNQLLGLVFALLFFSILIAVFGIANTLGLSVLERTRELGLLRAVGMTRRQMRSMVRWESVIIALFGSALGLIVGVLFGYVLTDSLEDAGIRVFAIPYLQLVLAVVFAALAGVLAAVLPARRAARVDILRALSVQ